MDKPRSYYQEDREQMKRFLPPQYPRVLEIGCGEALFRDHLDQPHEYWGVEPDQIAAAKADGKVDKLLVGIYREVATDLPDDYFDLVICNDVIEHMMDHDAFFEAIKKKLKVGGHIVASLPNVRYISNLIDLLVKKDWQYTYQGILDKTHFRFFTKKSLLRTVGEHGYAIEQFEGINAFERRSVLRFFVYYIGKLIFGSDVIFQQFAMRIRYDTAASSRPAD